MPNELVKAPPVGVPVVSGAASLPSLIERTGAAVHRMKGEGVGVSSIARATGLSRPTIYRVLGRGGEGTVEGREGRRRPRGRRRV